MDAFTELQIPYKGLQNGVHQYRFELGDAFFACFEKSSISNADFVVDLQLDRRDHMIVLELAVSGSYRADCDRCLASIDIPLRCLEALIVKFESEERTEDDIVYLDPKKNFLDLSGILYESIHVNLPVQNVRDCDREANRYCDQKVLGMWKETREEKQDGNEIWGELKKLKI